MALLAFSLVAAFIFFALADLQNRPYTTDPHRRAAVTLALVATLLLTVFRPVAGDTSRYWQFYQALDFQESLGEALVTWGDPSFVAISAAAKAIGCGPLLFFGVLSLAYYWLTYVAIRRFEWGGLHAAVLLSYVPFPYFIAYGANGVRQGIAMALIFNAVGLYRKGQAITAILVLCIAPTFHAGTGFAAVVAGAIAVIAAISNERAALRVATMLAAISLVMSALGINRLVATGLTGLYDIRARHEIYLKSAQDYGYRAGFRLDYVALSALPLLLAWAMRSRYRGGSRSELQFWLALYCALNSVYHLFSFAPFSDRFGALSWYYIPLIVALVVRDAPSGSVRRAYPAVSAIAGLIAFVGYSSSFLQVDWTLE